MLKIIKILFFCFLSYFVYASDVDHQLKSLEKKYHLIIGVYVHDTNNNRTISYRSNQRFPFQSTFKVMPVALMLKKDLAQKKVSVSDKDLIFWHPISGKYLNKQVCLKTLAEGAISYSDNPATNMIIKEVGGLEEINQFSRSISNSSFKLKHYESYLNSNPKLAEDSSTPRDMGLSIEKILLGHVLSDDKKDLLLSWMRNNTTGYKRIRAGVPLGWAVADKTGSGDFGIANDIGIAWSPNCKPVVLSIFTVSNTSTVRYNDHVIAKITEIIFDDLLKTHSC